MVKQDGPILRITLNQPERGNAVTDDMVRELTKLIRQAPKKSDIVVLRGAGKDFCVGRAGMGARPAVEPTAYTRRNFSDVVFDAYGAMRNCPIPIIAVVQGGAHGFGCAIAAACDITIASDKAKFSVPEMAHQIMPTMVMSSFVDRVPRKAMAYLVYSMFEVSPSARCPTASSATWCRPPSSTATSTSSPQAMLKAPSHLAPQRQGIRPHRARHAGRGRRRIRPQPARHHQLGRGDQEAAITAMVANHRKPV